MTPATAATDSLKRLFETRSDDLPGDARLASLRKMGMETFFSGGLPTKKDEAWKYTSLTSLAATRFDRLVGCSPTKTIDLVQSRPRPELESSNPVIFFDDTPHPRRLGERGLPKGVHVGPIAGGDPIPPSLGAHETLLGTIAVMNGAPFVALNTAFFCSGLHIEIDPGVKVEVPIHVLSTPSLNAEHQAFFPRLLVHLGAGAELLLMESYGGRENGAHLTNAVTEIALERGALLEHVVESRAGTESFHIGSTHVHQEEMSSFRSHLFARGGTINRHEIRTNLAEPGANAFLGGLMLGREAEHLDSQTLIDHRATGCTSRETYRSVLDGRASAVFNGRVIVRPGADGSDARQTNHNLLLSDTAVANTKPQLEIFADDVKCAHGATVGQLDADAVHYLRSRGLSDTQARDMLVFGFAEEFIREVQHPAARDLLREQLSAWLEAQ